MTLCDSTCCQAWWPTLHLQSPQGGRREWTPQNCPLTSTHMPRSPAVPESHFLNYQQTEGCSLHQILESLCAFKCIIIFKSDKWELHKMGKEFERACWGGVMIMGPRTVVPRDGGTWLPLLCMSTDLVFCRNGPCLESCCPLFFCVNTNLIMLIFLIAHPREFFIGWSESKNSYWDIGRLFSAGQATLSLSKNLHS